MNVPALNEHSTTLLIVVLRLEVTDTGRLRYATLVDLNERTRGRFSGWDGAVPALARFVAEEIGATGDAPSA